MVCASAQHADAIRYSMVAQGGPSSGLVAGPARNLLLRELWRACPSVLQHAVPQIDAELSADNTNLRQLATATLGDMIAGIGAAGPPPPPPLDLEGKMQTVKLAVVGAHLEGMPLHWQLTSRNAKFERPTAQNVRRSCTNSRDGLLRSRLSTRNWAR